MARPKVAVIGLDCADPRLVFDEWLDDLPNLRRLITRGMSGPLRTIDPPISVPAWTCMVTGRDPGELGIYGFRNRIDHSYHGLATADATWVRSPTLWDLVGREQRSSIVIGVPQTYPPPTLNGALVSCFLTPDTRRSTFTHPPELGLELTRVLGSAYKVDVEDYRTDDRDRILSEVYTMTEQRFSVARHLLSSHEWDLFMMHEIGLDRVQHAFWRYFDSTHRDFQPNHRYATVIKDYYTYLDEQIGELVDEYLPPDTIVLVVSDHGSQKMQGAICVNEWLIQRGYMTLRERVSQPVAFAKAPIDWSHTRAWGEGGHYSRVCLNVVGREPEGIVRPEEYDKLREELIQELEGMTDPDGRLLGTRAYRPEDLWAERAGIPPDLVVYFGDLAWRSNGLIGSGSIYNFENDTGPDDANHTLFGMFVMAGPGVSPRRVDDLSIFDVAPTVLAALGIEPTERRRGRVLIGPTQVSA